MLSACLPSSVRLCFGQPCSPSRNGRLARPCDRSTYTYMSSGRSPALLASFSRVPPGFGPKQSRAWHLWSSSSRNVAPRPRSPSLPLRVGQRTALTTDKHIPQPKAVREADALAGVRHAAPLPHNMLNHFKPSQQILTDIYHANRRFTPVPRGLDCSMLVNLGSDCHLTAKLITNLTCKHTRHFHSHQYIYSISLPCEYTPKPYLLLVVQATSTHDKSSDPDCDILFPVPVENMRQHLPRSCTSQEHVYP